MFGANCLFPEHDSALFVTVICTAAHACSNNVEMIPADQYVVLQYMAEAKRLGLQSYVESSGGVSAAAVIAGGEAVDGAVDEEEDSLLDTEEGAELQ